MTAARFSYISVPHGLELCSSARYLLRYTSVEKIARSRYPDAVSWRSLAALSACLQFQQRKWRCEEREGGAPGWRFPAQRRLSAGQCEGSEPRRIPRRADGVRGLPQRSGVG